MKESGTDGTDEGIDGAHVAFPDTQGRGLHLIENGQPIRELFN